MLSVTPAGVLKANLDNAAKNGTFAPLALTKLYGMD